MADKVFVSGMIPKKKPTSPEFVIVNLSFKVDEFKTFLDEHKDAGWVNVVVKESKGGKIYAELDTWKPNSQEKPPVDDNEPVF